VTSVFSVICCSNSEETLSRVLGASLERQESHQFLVWRNTPDENLPVPVVYNRLVRDAEGDWLLFVHQDVRLFDGALASLECKLRDLEERWSPVGIFGAAGATVDGWLHDGCCRPASYRGYHVGVQTLDECLFGCRPGLLRELGGFAEVEELAWHCYAGHLSYVAEKAGYLNYAVQALAWHEGPHQATALHLSTLRVAQAWLARQARETIGTSGGPLKLVPGGDPSTALQLAVEEGCGAGEVAGPADSWAGRTDCCSETTRVGQALLGPIAEGAGEGACGQE